MRYSLFALIFIEHTESTHGLKNVLYLFVYRSFGNQTLSKSLFNFFRLPKVRIRHFEIETAVCRSHSRVNRTPIAHYNSLESPFLSQQINIEVTAFGSVKSVKQIVAVHNSSHFCLFHSFTESGEINFIQSTEVNVGIYVHASPFHVVGGKMLDGGNNTFGLHA